MTRQLKFLFSAFGVFAALIAAGLLLKFPPLIRAGSTALLGYGIGAVLWGAMQLIKERIR